MANSSKTATTTAIIREEDLQDLEDFQHDLEEKIDRAHTESRPYIMAQYVGLLAKVQAEVKRIRNRFEREGIASRRKKQKELKAQSKGATAQSNTPPVDDASSTRNDG
jgi:hypothetical protein